MEILVLQVDCPRCGCWRGRSAGIVSLQACPKCGEPREAAVLGTCVAYSASWEFWERPLSIAARQMMLTDTDEAGAIRRQQKRGREPSRHYRKDGQLAVARYAEGDFCDDVGSRAIAARGG